jgi:hypothetical protein
MSIKIIMIVTLLVLISLAFATEQTSADGLRLFQKKHHKKSHCNDDCIIKCSQDGKEDCLNECGCRQPPRPTIEDLYVMNTCYATCGEECVALATIAERRVCMQTCPCKCNTFCVSACKQIGLDTICEDTCGCHPPTEGNQQEAEQAEQEEEAEGEHGEQEEKHEEEHDVYEGEHGEQEESDQEAEQAAQELQVDGSTKLQAVLKLNAQEAEQAAQELQDSENNEQEFNQQEAEQAAQELQAVQKLNFQEYEQAVQEFQNSENNQQEFNQQEAEQAAQELQDSQNNQQEAEQAAQELQQSGSWWSDKETAQEKFDAQQDIQNARNRIEQNQIQGQNRAQINAENARDQSGEIVQNSDVSNLDDFEPIQTDKNDLEAKAIDMLISEYGPGNDFKSSVITATAAAFMDTPFPDLTYQQLIDDAMQEGTICQPQ